MEYRSCLVYGFPLSQKDVCNCEGLICDIFSFGNTNLYEIEEHVFLKEYHGNKKDNYHFCLCWKTVFGDSTYWKSRKSSHQEETEKCSHRITTEGMQAVENSYDAEKVQRVCKQHMIEYQPPKWQLM
uniref:Uncharacterized protein n=1 Tax=Pithovirus LCPAC304 TaxID=2506594 RepID=A0A481ZC70_9VIRU|nr:MAG: hypothetical protein LCPAC304_06080 [Pithovirus LCPAC304]